jgi:transcriptional regulator with XRE-family HTH domain
MVAKKARLGSPKSTAEFIEAGKWLRNLRHYWQITQAELAEQTGLADSAMVEWLEAGEVRLPSFLYPAFARAFVFDPAEFAETCAVYYAGRIPRSESRSAA